MTIEDHASTRTFAGKGKGTMNSDKGLTVRQRLLLDVKDVRSKFGRKYNKGLIQMLEYNRSAGIYGK